MFVRRSGSSVTGIRRCASCSAAIKQDAASRLSFAVSGNATVKGRPQILRLCFAGGSV